MKTFIGVLWFVSFMVLKMIIDQFKAGFKAGFNDLSEPQ